MDVTLSHTDDLLRSRLRRPSSVHKTTDKTSRITDIRPVVRGYQARGTIYDRVRPRVSVNKPSTPVPPKTYPDPNVIPKSRSPMSGRRTLVTERHSPTATQSAAMMPQAEAAASPRNVKRQLKLSKPSASSLLIVAAVFIFMVGAFVSFDSWRTNRAAEAAAKKMTSTSVHTERLQNNDKQDEAPATTAPTGSDIRNYTVAPSKPRLLTIPKIGVTARILPEGVTKDGSLAAPGNVHDAGWYTSSSLPGTPGAMLLDGHVSSWTTNGVFYDLKKLVPGDIISVERGDGKVLRYKVVKSQKYDASSVDMQAAATPVAPGTPGLNLITCTGKVKPGTSDFSERLIVFTKQIN